MSYNYIITMVSNLDEAKLIAQSLVTKKLAACVNIVPQVISVYEWKGELCSDGELMVFIKTKKELFDEVKTEILLHHSYEIPAIVSIPIENAHKPFLEWIEGQCKNS